MSADLNAIPAIPSKWALSDNLNKKYNRSTTSKIPGVKVYLAPFSDAAREMNIPNTLVKIAKGIGQYFSTLEGSVAAKEFVANCNIFNDVVKVFSFAKGVDDILTNVDKKNAKGIDLHQRNLSIASGFFQLIISGMAGVKLLNVFGVLSIAQIAAELGTTVVLPFSVVGNGVEIAKNVVDITNKALNISKTDARKAKIKKNHKNFKASTNDASKDVANSAKIAAFLDAKLTSINAKNDAAAQKLTDQVALGTAQAKVQAADDKYQETVDKLAALNTPGVNKFHKTTKSISLNVTKLVRQAALFEAKAAHDQVIDDYTKTKAKLDGRVVKLAAWTNVKDAFDKNADVNGSHIKRDAQGKLDDTDLVNQMIGVKTERWRTMRKNCNLSNLKDGISIAISVAATIGLIAAIVLTFTGIGTIPALLTMTSLWLLISVAGLGSSLLSKYKKPAVVPTTNYRHFAAAAA